MTSLMRPLLGILALGLITALLAPQVQAADIPAYDGGSQTPGESLGARADIPLDRPSIEQTALLPWVSELATTAYGLDPDNFQDTLKKVSVNYTTEGWKAFTMALTGNKIPDQVTKEGLVMSIQPGTPILVSQGAVDGIYQWVITMPGTFNYVKKKEQHYELTTINITIVRVPQKDNLLGIQVANWTQS